MASGRRLIVAIVECLTAPVHSAEELRARYRLTPAECRVAQELAHGHPNEAIAQRLGVSPHTARRHTERVLAKLGARSRGEVTALLRS
jgi:non-specific serine/threonine protein kinase